MTLKRAFALARVDNTYDLYRAYVDADQALMVPFVWNYDDPNQLINKIKTALDDVDLSSLSKEDHEWCRQIFWFWHHHAISCAVVKKDQKAAQRYSVKALEYLDDDHPNMITRLLYYLVHDKLYAAKQWADTITDEECRKTALEVVGWYEEGHFF